jgi:hypothetical protein
MERHARADRKHQPAVATAAPVSVPANSPETGEQLIESLQRTAGNRAVADLFAATQVQRQPPVGGKKPDPPPAKPAKPRVRATLEEIVQEMTGLGGPYKDLAAWKDAIKPGKFLGHNIEVWNQTTKGVHPDFQAKLDLGKKKVDDEYAKNKTKPPPGYGIGNVGGFRNEVSPHGAGVAVDIDANKNPYIAHAAGPNTEQIPGGKPSEKETKFDAEIRPVYHRIAAFIMNEPVGTEDSIIPKLITTGTFLPGSTNKTRRDRLGEYYERLLAESDAMKLYFRLMRDEAALKAFIDGDWKTKHPKATPPVVADTVKQMWQDFALLGGKVPKEISDAADWVAPTKQNRPFGDPGAGFVSIPKEVVVGLGQAVGRWGAIDFGTESGDVMHFDDRYGLGKPFDDAKTAIETRLAAAAKKQIADEAAAAKAAKEGAKAPTTPTPTPAPTPTTPAPTTQKLQRSAGPGVARQPVVARQPKGPGHRPGEAWDYGPITKRQSASYDLAAFITFIKAVEKGYGADKQMVLQRLRRLYYSSYSGTAGKKFDEAIEDQPTAGGEPITTLAVPAWVLDALFEVDTVKTPAGHDIDPRHILAALDVQTSGVRTKAAAGAAVYNASWLGIVTWTGDLASWWLDWSDKVKAIYATPPPAPTGPATDEGPPSEVGGDPLVDQGLFDQVAGSKASKHDLLADMDGQILAATSTQKSSQESVKREGRQITKANVGIELTAPVSSLLERYYETAGRAAGAGAGASKPLERNRFPAFVTRASPPIPHQESSQTVTLTSDAEDAIYTAIRNTARVLADFGTKDGFDARKRYHFRLREIAKRFKTFLETGLKNGDAGWP